MNTQSGWDAQEVGPIIDAVTALKDRILADSVGYKDQRFRATLDERADLIKAFCEKYGDTDLPTICMALRMSCNGAADPWGNEFLADVVKYLSGRMHLWLLPIDAIDYCVYVMCGETVKLGESELADRNARGVSYSGLEGEGWK